MLLRYFGFHEEPFGVTPDPRYLFPSQTHREALASIKYSFQSNRGFTTMIAPPGMGKTTILRRFLEDIRETTCSVFLFNIDPTCEPREFVTYILREIGITPGCSSSEMHGQLSDALVKETRAGRKFVVVIDEAQNLSDAVLERVRLLTNFETSRGKLMHIVLSGQPQLTEKLLQPSLVQLRQRLSTICRLDALTNEETEAYINHRLRLAGYQGESLFTKEALCQIAEASQGIPRTINNLCFNALSLCCAHKSRLVDISMVAEAMADLRLTRQSLEVSSANSELAAAQPPRTKAQALIQKVVHASALLLVFCFFVILGLTGFRYFQSRTTYDARSLSPKGSPALVRAPPATKTGPTSATTAVQGVGPILITVESGQTLKDISYQYLGGYDRLRLQHIQALNPALIDPDHIEVGQKILLPGSMPAALEHVATHRGSERTLQ